MSGSGYESGGRPAVATPTDDYRAHAERLQLALNASGMGSWEMDMVNNRRRWSPETMAMHGLNPGDVKDGHVELNDKLIHPDDRIRLKTLHDELRAGRDDYFFEYRTTGTGEERWIVARGTVISRTGQGPDRIVGVTSDVTANRLAEAQRRATEAALAIAAERFATSEEAASAVAYDFDVATGVRWQSGGLFKVLGWRPLDLAPDVASWNALVHPDDLPLLLEMDTNGLLRADDHYVAEYRMRHKRGHYVWVLDSGQVYRDASGAVSRQAGAAIDISAQRSIELALRRQIALIDLSFEPIFVWHRERGIVEWNRGAEQVYGFTREEALGKSSHNLLRAIHPVSLDEIARTQEQTGAWSGEIIHFTKDGRRLAVDSRQQLIASNGETLVLEANRDISERKKAEAFTARVAAVALASHDALFGTTLDGHIEAWNPGAERLFGFSAEEAMGQHISILSPPRWHGEQHALLSRVAAGESVGPLDTERMRKDGKLISVSLAVAPVKAADGTVIAISAAAHDVSDRKEWEARQRLMSRELAHRVKNSFAVLQAILRSTLKTSDSPAQFAAAFSGRLYSLAAAQDALTASDWRGAELGALVRLQLSYYVGSDTGQAEISGPPVNLAADQAAPFGLIINELATNAIKHGALSVPAGKVQLSWTCEATPAGQQRLVFTWRETGGPSVIPPQRRGFGSTLIARSLPGADVKMDFHADGLVCVVDTTLEC